MRWFVVPDGGSAAQQAGRSQILAVHAALLHTGQVLYFSGDQHDPGQHRHNHIDASRLFDATTMAVTGGFGSPTTDTFCCGHAFLSDGRLLIAGGTEDWTLDPAGGPDGANHVGHGHFRGHAESWLFDPTARTWSRTGRMVFEPGYATGGGRWYPTLLTLGDGDVVAMTGHPLVADHRHNNTTVEVYDASSGTWSNRGELPFEDLTYYPRLHLLPDGSVFCASPMDGSSWRWDPTAPRATAWRRLGGRPGAAWANPEPENYYGGFDTTSVLLPLRWSDGYRPRVLMAGKRDAVLIDLGATAPAWVPLPRPAPATRRYHANTVLLPTGDVLLVGGMANPGNDPGSAALDTELFVTATSTWVRLPAPGGRAAVPRNYHSVALLLPDGRVWAGGGNERGDWSFHDGAAYAGVLPTTAADPGVENRERRIEIFEPWYWGRADRPTLTLPDADVRAGGTLLIDSAQAAEISRVVLVRQGSVTHAYNSDQRLVEVPFTRVGTRLHAQLPPGAGIFPPGRYLTFVLRQVVDPATGAVLEVPSTGVFARIRRAKTYEVIDPKFASKEIALKEHVKVEIKENLKEEVEAFDKRDWEVPKRKDIAEGFPMPIEELAWVRALVERVEGLERQVASGAAFIPPDLRPDVPVHPVVEAAHHHGEHAPPPDRPTKERGGAQKAAPEPHGDHEHRAPPASKPKAKAKKTRPRQEPPATA